MKCMEFAIRTLLSMTIMKDLFLSMIDLPVKRFIRAALMMKAMTVIFLIVQILEATSPGDVRQKKEKEVSWHQRKPLNVKMIVNLLMDLAMFHAQKDIKALEKFVFQDNALLDTLNVESTA